MNLELAMSLPRKWVDGYRIKAIGGTVYGFKDGAPDNGKPIMSTSDACAARRALLGKGIKMERIDAGGSPEWQFTASTNTSTERSPQ